MGALVETLTAACEEELNRITDSVYNEMFAIVSGRPYATGEAAGAITIERGDMSSFVGGSHPHLYWLNCGNGGGRITSTRKFDSLGRAPGKLNTRFGYKTAVSSYPGIDFVSTIASHY